MDHPISGVWACFRAFSASCQSWWPCVTKSVSCRDQTEAAYLTLASFLFAIPTSILAGCLLWLLTHFSSLGYGSLPWQAPLLMSCAMLFVGVFTALRYWCLREERFTQVSQ